MRRRVSLKRYPGDKKQNNVPMVHVHVLSFLGLTLKI